MQQKTAEIKTLYKNGSGAQSPKVQAIADTLVKLREEADKAISASVGQDYQAWKNQYGQYKEAAEGLMKIFNKKNNSFGGRFADIISLEQLARGVATLEPNLVTGAAVIKGAQKFGSWLFGNDKAIKDVFNVIDKYGAKAAGKDIKVPFNEPFTMPGKQNKFDLSGKNLPKQLEAPAPGAETFSPLEMPGRIMPPAEVKVVPKKKVIIKKK
jgi:hypothetical protein